MIRRICLCMAVASLTGVLAGCASLEVFGWTKPDAPVASAKNPVVQVLALWQPGEGTDADGNPCRGFVGQVYFFTRESPIPATVDGDVRVYVFDDQGTQDEQVKPIHQFDFSPEAWKLHVGKGKLGPTYALFIPYTRKGTHAAQCALRVRFQSRNGQKMFSEMSTIPLSGTKKKAAETETAEKKSSEEAKDDKLAAKETRNLRSMKSQSLQDVLASIPRNEPTAARRARGAPLTDAERERIMREHREKLKIDTPADHPAVPVAKPLAKPRQLKPVPVTIDNGESESETEAEQAPPESDDQASRGGGFRWKTDRGSSHLKG
jgi:hypothetical protein